MSIRNGSSQDDPMPSWTWDDLEQALSDLAAGTQVQALVPGLVSATRKESRFKTADGVLREVLCLTSAVLDDDFARKLRERGASPLPLSD